MKLKLMSLLAATIPPDEEVGDDEEAEAELLRVDSGSELPGAFPHDVSRSSAEPSGDEPPTRPRTRKRDSEKRQVMRSWVGGDEEPEMRETGFNKPLTPKPVSTDSQGRKTKTTTTASNKIVANPSSKPNSSRRSTSARAARSTSVASDAPTEEADQEDEATTTTKQQNTRSSTLRRSSRLSATPADVPEVPKSKKLRASQSPPRETKRKGRSRSSSSGPAATGSSLRLTRRQGPVLESLEE